MFILPWDAGRRRRVAEWLASTGRSPPPCTSSASCPSSSPAPPHNTLAEDTHHLPNAPRPLQSSTSSA